MVFTKARAYVLIYLLIYSALIEFPLCGGTVLGPGKTDNEIQDPVLQRARFLRKNTDVQLDTLTTAR